MVKQNTPIKGEKRSFQVVFVGLDVHKTKWSVSIYEGQKHKQTYSMEADVEQLIKKLKKSYGGYKVKLCYEAGFCGYWLQRRLEESGYTCIIVHAADIPSSDRNKRRKSDRVDSKHLGLMLSRDLLEGIYIPSQEQEQIRELVRLRINISKDRRRYMNQIRAYINRQGLSVPADLAGRCLWTKRGGSWLEEQSKEHLALGGYYSSYLDKKAKEQEVGLILRQSIEKSSYESTYEVLLSIPGIGWRTASLLIAELGSMLRFKNLDRLASYCGLVPDVRSSADKVKVLGLTSRGNKRLRTALIESAWIARRKDHSLGQVYQQAIERGKPAQSAIIKVGRKLLGRLRAVWISQQTYQMAS